MIERLDIILQRLNKIDKTQDDIAGRLEHVNLYIAKSEERERQTTECLKRFGDRLDKHDDRIQKLQDAIQEITPVQNAIQRLWHGLLGAFAASVVWFFTRGGDK